MAALVILTLLPHLLSTYLVYLMTEVIIDCLFALSLNMLIGYSGMVSFGQSAFFAVGAYSAAVFITRLGWPMSISFSIAPFIAALWAAITGIFCIRRTGVYFIMLTLAMAQVVYAAISQWYDFTGGDNGIIGVSPSSLIASPLRYYYFTLIVSLLAGYGIYRVLHSPFGYSLRAFRDNPARAESIGINVWKAVPLARRTRQSLAQSHVWRWTMEAYTPDFALEVQGVKGFFPAGEEYATRQIQAQVSSELGAILDRSWGDCHLNRTAWPSFTWLAPLSWLYAYAVAEGRKAVNFSEWASYPPERPRQLLDATCQDVTAGKMPGLWATLHSEAQLSPHDVGMTCAAVHARGSR